MPAIRRDSSPTLAQLETLEACRQAEDPADDKAVPDVFAGGSVDYFRDAVFNYPTSLKPTKWTC